jgi:predicted RNA polymerase sigma factor
LREKGDWDGASPERSLDRLSAVLQTVHLLFNEGYWSSADGAPIRADLCRLALGSSQSLVETYPVQIEAMGLLSLLLMHEARREAKHARNDEEHRQIQQRLAQLNACAESRSAPLASASTRRNRLR